MKFSRIWKCKIGIYLNVFAIFLVFVLFASFAQLVSAPLTNNRAAADQGQVSIDIDYIVDPTPATISDTFNDSTKIASSSDITVANSVVTLATLSSWACGNNLIDARDGKTYATVLINSQCWMAQNLNIGTKITSCTNGYAGTCTTGGDTVQNQGTDCPSASEIEKYCYSDSEGNCTTYGGLYQWNQAMCGSTTEGATGICPTGWHIPTDAEQYTLENYLKDDGQTCDANRSGTYDCLTAGTKLKSGGSSGFNGLLAGTRASDGSFAVISVNAYFWSSLQSVSYAWYRNLLSVSAGVRRYTSSQAYGFSVRCLKN